MAEKHGGQTADAEIAGIYTNTEMQEEISVFSHMFYENIVFTALHTCWQLHGNGGTRAVDDGDFYVDAPAEAELENSIERIKGIKDINWKKCSFSDMMWITKTPGTLFPHSATWWRL